MLCFITVFVWTLFHIFHFQFHPYHVQVNLCKQFSFSLIWEDEILHPANATAWNHVVVKGFYSAPAQEIYTLEACSTYVGKGRHPSRHKYCSLISRFHCAKIIELYKTIYHYFYTHKNPSQINFYGNSFYYTAQRSPQKPDLGPCPKPLQYSELPPILFSQNTL
jgi:hypothetical protein